MAQYLNKIPANIINRQKNRSMTKSFFSCLIPTVICHPFGACSVDLIKRSFNLLPKGIWEPENFAKKSVATKLLSINQSCSEILYLPSRRIEC